MVGKQVSNHLTQQMPDFLFLGGGGVFRPLELLVGEDGNPQVSKTLRSQFDSDDLRQL